ncbi:acetyltransferase [Endozoicomonas numazuensis]|uniref:PglD N-terminal domain-containing protein n=1 Tax=Endozoicomonas numazuensis TaxID=1137799 RepID=A0A081N3Q3_9GAMM|nr:acetyltransferase [Endozoicomonas numazuensis]KEQ13076.1 hypothetical protein GZ78_26320 [Endozoicomonas numazuensis]
MKNTLLILGAGGHAKVVADCALTTGLWQSVCFLDDRFPMLKKVGCWPVIGCVSDMETFVDQFPSMALGVGVNYDALRLQWLERGLKAGAQFPAVIHPASVISSFASVGQGAVVFAGVVVNVATVIGRACILNTNSTVDHDCHVDDGSHISPGASLAGGVSIGKAVWVGMGSQIIQGVSIGSGAIVGAGAVVLDDVAENTIVVGVPAKLIS